MLVATDCVKYEFSMGVKTRQLTSYELWNVQALFLRDASKEALGLKFLSGLLFAES